MLHVHHVAIAVSDLEKTATLYNALFDLEVSYRETVEAQGVKIAFLPVGDSLIELLEPLNSESGVGSFIQKRGEGLHHIAFAVPDIDATLAQLKAKGVRLIDEEARIGAAGHRIAFIHPKAAGGVLVELVEETADH